MPAKNYEYSGFSRRNAVALVVFAGFGCACGGTSEAKNPAFGLPPYTPEDARLFDDLLASELFDYKLDGRVAEADPLLAERAARADTATLMKVTTLSREGSGAAYSLTLRPVGAIAGRAETAALTLTVSAANPSFLFLDAAGGAWVGTELVLLARRYRQGEEAAVHFRAEPSRPQIVDVVARARR